MTDIFVTDFVITILIFLRILSAFISAPIFGAKAIPVKVRVFLSAFIAYMIFYSIDSSNIQIQFSIWFLIVAAVKEIVAGLVIGFMLNLVFYAMQFAGSFIGFDMGLMMANVMNPMEETTTTVMGEVLYYGGLLVFLTIDGHHFLISGLNYSFTLIPIGMNAVNASVYKLLLIHSAAVFVLAVKISSPILVSYFLINIAEGVTARVMPQMQVFFVTQPLKLGLGFVLLAVGSPLYVMIIKNLLESYEYSLTELIKAMV